YGKSPEPDDFAAVQSEQLMAYYQNYYKPEYCTLVVAGNVSSFVQEQLQELFGESWTSFSSARHPDSPQSAQHTLTFPEACGKVHLITRPDALQSALRLGFRTVQRSHSDFPGLQFLNTVLGGYFGSRLMANIREDKG